MKNLSSKDKLAINLKYYRYKLNLSQEKFTGKLEIARAKLITYNKNEKNN